MRLLATWKMARCLRARNLRADLGPVRCSRSPKGGYTMGEIPLGRGIRDGDIAVLRNQSHTSGPGDDPGKRLMRARLVIPVASERALKLEPAGD